jgi:16S rRNA (guanine527-N7)-methyltransferase
VSDFRDLPSSFYESIANLGVEFDDGDVEKLGLFLDLLYETNRLFNLTAIKDPEEAWTKHVLDSLSLIPQLAKEKAEHVVDVGSGGGFPGMPLAITLPEVTFTLVEATKKKAIFLAETIEHLGLDNVTVISDRAENLATKDGGFRNIADAVIARAVGPLKVLLELTVPFAKVGGAIVAIKGERAPIEIEEAQDALLALKSEVESINRTTTGTILVIRKMEATPNKYPRVAGEPKRFPIGSRGKK